MTPSSPQGLTPDQRKAIEVSGDVLVVAGAGTGKTRTLVERCLRRIQEGGCVSRFLMVTFTEAAAAEMRSRLRAELLRHSQTGDPSAHLQEQVALVETAAIGTLHAFCLGLVRENFHRLSLDPQLVVLDETQAGSILEDTLDALLDPLLEGTSELSRDTRSLLSSVEGDAIRALRRQLVRLHRFSQSMPSPRKWIEGERARFSQSGAADWRALAVEEVRRWAAGWSPTLAARPPHPNLSASLAAIGLLTSSPPGEEATVTALRSILAADATWARGTMGVSRDPVKAFFTEAEFLASLLDLSPGASDPMEPIQQDWDRVRGHMETLLRLCGRLGEDFASAKREVGGVDFSDLEQFALRLLQDTEGRPTDVALECRERFDHVFVDEVQDINAAQDAILRAVSREGAAANRFLVGDMKQSIYRFRLADPTIFRSYERRWRNAGLGGTAHVIDLSDNFRSREGVLAAVNALFSRVMVPEIGGLRYGEEACLRFGNRAGRALLQRKPGVENVELRVLDKAGGDDDTATGDSVEREAAWAASRLRQLKESGFEVWDEQLKEHRPVRWSDMVILLRSPGATAESFAKAFHREGVPLLAPRGGFFDSQEILDLLSLLRILDNPLQNIPLLAVLRSPLAGFSLEELAGIRSIDKRVPFWTALQRCAAVAAPKPGDPAEDPSALPGRRARHFVEAFLKWRDAVRVLPISGCLEEIMAVTDYETLMAAGFRGEARRANIRRFLELARQFDPYQRQGLFRFLQFLDTQEEGGTGIEPAADAGSDAVRLMSIHRSKGLEFPVVLVAQLGRRFNMGDLYAEWLLDPELGLCPRATDPASGERYPTIAHWTARRRGQREQLGEEVRLLYVAATRARDRLILLGTHKPEKWMFPGEAEGVVADPVPALAAAQCALDWIRPWFLDCAAVPGKGLVESGGNDLICWSIGSAESPGSPAAPLPAAEPSAGVVPPGWVESFVSRMNWVYPHADATVEPAKTTVSVLKRRHEEDSDETVDATWLRRAPRRDRAGEGGGEAGLSATERGSRHHLFLQWLDLDRAASYLDLRNEGERLLRAGVLDEAGLQSLDFHALANFWQSEVGRLIRSHSGRVERELPFTARLSGSELSDILPARQGVGLDPDDFVVVQGQIDLAVILDDEIWLLDFKTDAVSTEEVAGRVEAYRPQLEVYARALFKIQGLPVTRRWIHFLAVSRTESLDP